MSDQAPPRGLAAAVLITPGRAWTRFTYARTDLELLGVVQMGLQIGALARLASGGYAQVNGDFVAELDTEQIDRALRRVMTPPPSTAPVVSVKKRRRIAVATD